jgi:hypothetical protein
MSGKASPDRPAPPATDPAPHHPFFRPLWRRVLVLAICVGWTAFEIVYADDPFWLVIAGGMALYALWDFFLRIPLARRFRR